MNSKTIRKYLGTYSEKEVAQLDDLLHFFSEKDFYSNALLIPAYLENTDFIAQLKKQPPRSKGKFLLALVSNHPLETTLKSQQTAQKKSHNKLLEYLGKPSWASYPFIFYKEEDFDILLVDRTGKNGIPVKQGVGLARKIAADLITFLISKNVIKSRWIMSTDADALLPKDYFEINTSKEDVALVYSFKHSHSEDEISIATRLYEKSIRHYVEGLRYAKSDYAFLTLGSCLAFNVEAYTKVRGFPKRAAGEDFYLLNKLAKLGSIKTKNTPTISIESRISRRVPFGTGPAVEKMINSSERERAALFYEPEIFVQLKAVLQALLDRPSSLNEMQLPENTANALRFLDIDQAFAHANKQNLKPEQYKQHIKTWFDGFRTLKFVHYLRDHGHPMLCYQELKGRSSGVNELRSEPFAKYVERES